MTGKGGSFQSPRKSATATGEFALRLGSALVMAAIAIALTWAGPWPFILLVGFCASVLAWEWARMTVAGGANATAAIIAASAIAAAIFSGAGYLAAAAAVIACGTVVSLARPGRGRRVAGLLYIAAPAAAVAALRADPAYGLQAVIFLLLSVWCADIMAYVVGRLAGGPKLAPAISPGKTWSGAAGGVVCPVALAYAYAAWLGNTSPVILGMVAAGLAVAAQIGDLAESAVKRSAGVKDSGRLIPGHGGLLDRLDGFLAAAAFAGLLALLRNPGSPGRGLLIWP